MYVGRIVAVGRTKSGRVAALYRVSSRSFPNRTARTLPDGALIVPKAGFQDDIYKNPYIAYRCLQIVGDVAIATNGSHTDPIADKVRIGVPLRDAMAQALLTLDYEKDAYNTPRIAAAVRRGAETAFLGAVRKDGLCVREIPLDPGRAVYLATYEVSDVDPARSDAFDAPDAAAAARYMVEGGVFATLEHPVVAVCALESDRGFQIAVHTVGGE